MILRENTLTAQETLLSQLERAYDEGILKEFIGDYVGWVGTIEDVYTAQKLSDTIEEKDIDRAIRDLKEEGLLKEGDKSPYTQFCDVCFDLIGEPEDVVIDAINDLYFANIGDSTWDKAYDDFTANYTKDPEQFCYLLKAQRKNSKMNESLLNEFLQPSRLTTVGKILFKAKDKLESDAYNKELNFYKNVAHALRVKNVNELLIYTQDKGSLSTLLRDNLPRTKLLARQREVQLGDIKGQLYSDWGVVITSNAIFFRDEGSFKKLDKYLEGSRDRMPLETEDEITASDDVDNDSVTSSKPANILADELIDVYKTTSGNYYAKVEQLPGIEMERDFTSAEDCVKFVKKELKKKGYDATNFKVQKNYNTDSEVKVVSIGGQDYDTRKIAFVVNGRAYSYPRWNVLDDDMKAQTVIVARNGLLNREIVEEYWTTVDDAKKLLEGVIIELPSVIEVEFDGPEYLITNKDTDDYARGYVVTGDQADRDDYIYNVCKLCSPVCRRDELFDSIDECLHEDFDSDANLMTVEELLTAMLDNVPEAQIDEEIKRFRKYANLLGMKSSDYDKLVCLIDEDLDPNAVFDGARNISKDVKADYKVNFYPEQNIIVEYVNGNVFIYFKDELSCKQYYEMADKFLRSFDVDENPFNEEFIINKDAVNIEECLNILDKSNNNQYDLLNCYLESIHSAEGNAKLATMIRESATPSEIHEYLTGKSKKLFEDVDEDMTVEDYLQQATDSSDEGVLSVRGENTLNRACNWLDNNGIEFDTREVEGDGENTEFIIQWKKKDSVDMRYDDEQNAENKGVAMKLIKQLNDIKEMLHEISNSVVATKVAASYDLEIQDMLREALEVAKTFNY